MEHAKATVGTRTLRLLVCESGLERLTGLLNRPELDPGVALLIDPCWAVHTFGMRRPIDVVFCDSAWRIVHVVEALRPRRVACRRDAIRVLELRAASARLLGLVPGAKLVPETGLRTKTYARRAPDAPTPAGISPPVGALAGLAVLTICLLALLGGCATPRSIDSASARAPGSRAFASLRGATERTGPPPAALEELRLQTDLDYRSRAWLLADAELRELIRHEPTRAEHWRRLGVVLLNTGRAREAVESLEAAARLGPADAPTLQNLAIAHLRAACDRLEEAARLSDSPPGQAVAPASPGRSLDSVDSRDSLLLVAEHVRRLLPTGLRGEASGCP